MIGLHGAYYNNNFGDLLLLKIFETWIRENGYSDVVYPRVSEMEQDRFKKHFPNAFFGLSQRKYWKGLICAGGGYFGEPKSHRGKRFGGNWNKRFLKVHALPAELCIWSNIPYAILGVEVGPLSNVFVRQEVKRIFSHATVLSVRNIESKQFIQKTLGICPNVVMAPDAALTITTTDIPAQALNSVDRLLEQHRGMILLGIHYPSAFLANTLQAESMRIGLLSSLAAESDVVPVVFSDSGNSDFSPQCDQLVKLIQSSTGKECLSLPFLGIWETVALISKLSAILTTKLHVGMVAYALGIYCESFANHPKVPRFYDQIGRSSQCTMIDSLDQDKVMEKIERAVQFSRSKVSLIDQNWQNIKGEALLHRKLLSSFLSSAVKK